MRHPSSRALATHSRPALRRFTVLLILMLAAGAAFVAPALAAGSLGGVISNEFLVPVENAQVDVWRSPDGSSPYVWLGMDLSDSVGAYSVSTPGAGWYKVQFSDPLGRYATEWWANRMEGSLDEADAIRLDEDQHASYVNAVVQYAGRAGGVVRAAGVPVEGIRIDVFRWSDQRREWVGTAECYSAADGSWSAGGLTQGQYRFHFRDTRAVPVYADQFYDHQRFWDNAHQMGVYGGWDVDWIDADLEVGAFIGGVVQDEFGAPISGATVTACGYNPNTDSWPGVQQATTDAFGQYALGPLAPGDYRLWFQGGPSWLAEWWNDQRHDWDANVDSLVAGQHLVRNATLVPAGSISGHVTADGTGDPATPIEGIAVALYRWNGWDWWEVEGGWWFTDADGFYSAGGLEPGQYRVHFHAPNGEWAAEYYDNVPGWTGPNEVPVLGGLPTVVDASLAPAGHIAGTVRDLEGNPLAGIEITCLLLLDRDSGQWNWVGGVQTDGTGYFDIGGLPAGIHQMELSDPNGVYAVEVYENALNFGEGIDLEVVAGGTTSADPVLDRGGRVYGQVVDPGGNGIANVAVMFNGWRDNLDTPEDPNDGWWEWYTECHTDENGDFSMSGLQARPTVIQFQDWSGGFVEEWFDDARTDSHATPVDVRAGATHNIGRVELAPASHIAGTVTAQGGGGPLENIEVTIARWRDDWGDWDHFAGGQTDGDGHYDIGGLAAGAYRVRFWDGSGAYAGEWFENATDAWSGQDVAVTEGGTTQVDAALEAACVIEGHVTDGSANPLPGIEAILYYREAGGEWAQYQLDNEQRMFTDGDGYYRFAGLPARTYQLRLENNDNPSPWAAEVFDGALVVGTGTDLVLTPGETRTVDPQLDLGGSLAGRLLEDQPPFTPLSFAFPMEIGVWAWVPDAGPEGGSWQWYAGYATGEDTDGYMHGSPLAPGDYRIDINCWVGAYVPEWYDDAPDLEHSTPVTITPGGVTDLGDIYMTKSAMIYGTVTGPDGQPVAGVTVRKWTLVDGEWEPGYDFQSWSDGFYLLGEMAGGTYRVEFDGRGIGLSREFWDGASSLPGALSIVLDPREDVYGIDAQLGEAGALQGTVYEAGATVAAGVPVRLAVWDESLGRYVELDDDASTTKTDENGAWAVRLVTPGLYRVTAGPSTTHAVASADGVEVTQEETTTVDLTLPLGASISGTVTDIPGLPVPTEVSAWAWSEENGTWLALMEVPTAIDGSYTLAPLSAGKYRVRFRPSDKGSTVHAEFWDNRWSVVEAHDISLAEGQARTGFDAVLGPAEDVTPPSAPVVSGADGDWHASSVRLDFAATDDLSGVAEYEYRFAAWTTWEHGDHVIVGAPPDHENDGIWDLEVRAVDEVGNVSDSATAQVKIDTRGPVVSDDDPGDWLLRWVQVNLTATDAGCGVVDHIEYAPTSDGPWQVGTSFVVTTWKRGGGSGERTTWVRAIDGVGNASEPAAVVVRLDGRPPVTTSDSDGLAHEEDVTVHLTLNDAHSGAGITFFSVDGGMWMVGDTLHIPALPGGWNDGVHDVRFYSVDAVGNVEQPVKSCTVTIDTLGLL